MKRIIGIVFIEDILRLCLQGVNFNQACGLKKLSPSHYVRDFYVSSNQLDWRFVLNRQIQIIYFNVLCLWFDKTIFNIKCEVLYSVWHSNNMVPSILWYGKSIVPKAFCYGSHKGKSILRPYFNCIYFLFFSHLVRSRAWNSISTPAVRNHYKLQISLSLFWLQYKWKMYNFVFFVAPWFGRRANSCCRMIKYFFGQIPRGQP